MIFKMAFFAILQTLFLAFLLNSFLGLAWLTVAAILFLFAALLGGRFWLSFTKVI